jgi:vanillate O-demethylase ferredoxin subunit
MKVLIKSIKTEADDIVSLELVPAQDLTLAAFEAGAHIDLHLPNGLIRQYSLCNSPSETHRYQIAILKDPASRGGSEAVHSLLKEGDAIEISAPRNLFPLNLDAKKTLLFAGGIGITPILAMAETLHSLGKDFVMHYCARSQNKAAFVSRIQSSQFAQHVQFHFDDQAEKLDPKAIIGTPTPDTHIYVCGPNGFMQFIIDTASSQHWPADQVHKEYFSAASVDKTHDGSFEVEIKSTGKVITISPDQSVLEALEDEDIFLPVSCEEGICGTCVTGVLAGEPEHRDVFLTDAEKAANNQFTPCCSRSRSARLVLDL